MATITYKGSPIHTVGSLPAIGEKAPDFTVTKTDLSEIKLKNYLGKKVIMNIFPSLDTPTCASALNNFKEIANQFKNILILCISADLPFAQNRFFAGEEIKNIQPASIFRHSEFGKLYGVTITDSPLAGLLSRAIVILNEKGIVIYTQQVNEITDEPDYKAMVNALSKDEQNVKA